MVRTITDNLWRLMCSLMPPEQEFKRMALNYTTIEYYPKTVFYIQADSKGEYELATQTIKYLSNFQTASDLFNYKKIESQFPNFGIFTKDFHEKNWRRVDSKKLGSDISLEPRFFIALAKDRDSFIEKHHRKEVTSKDFDLGDKVFTYFAYTKDTAEAVIIQLGKESKFKLHFKGHSYRY